MGVSHSLGGAHCLGLYFGCRLIHDRLPALLEIPRNLRLGNSLVHGPRRLRPRRVERMAEVGGLRSLSLVVSQRSGKHR